MIFFLFALVILCVYQVTIYQKPAFCRDYLSKDNTMCVRGLFVLLIIASHFKQYVELSGRFDKAYRSFSNYLAQTVVVMFLFYSGYGIYEAVKAKGPSYIQAFPRKRILPTWVHFAAAILCFAAVNLCFGVHHGVRQTLLALTGWTSIGNSNWYMFAVFFLYFATWISFSCFSRSHAAALTAVTACSCLYVLLLYGRRDSYWYSTIFCYAAGMWYSYWKERIERFLFEREHAYYAALILAAFSVLFIRPYIAVLPVLYACWSVLFALMVVLVSMKISVHNPILHWFGDYTFEIYILQRIPMRILQQFHLERYPYLFFFLVLLTVPPIAWLFRKLLRVVDRSVLRL